MDSEGKRYEFIWEKAGLSKKDFAESLGLSMSTGSQITSGLLKSSQSLLNPFAETYSVNLHWFLTGDSMIEAHICDGDMAIFHPEETFGSDIFVVAIGNFFVVKRIDRNLATSPVRS